MSDPAPETCFECYHGEPEGRDRSKCLCLWPCLSGGKPEYIERPTEGDCKVFESRADIGKYVTMH